MKLFGYIKDYHSRVNYGQRAGSSAGRLTAGGRSVQMRVSSQAIRHTLQVPRLCTGLDPLPASVTRFKRRRHDNGASRAIESNFGGRWRPALF